MDIEWSRITDHGFEELCYDILEKSGFLNLGWIGRKGKDRGRDIIAHKQQTELRKVRMEKWLVQCKRYLSKGPSPADLRSDLAWADFHKPDVFLLMLANTLTANTFDWLEGVKKDMNYKIEVCDVKQIESLLEDFRDLKGKYFSTSLDAIAKKYLDQLAWASSKISLDGMGEFADKHDTDLAEVFIDIKGQLSLPWKPRNYETWQNPDPKFKFITIFQDLKDATVPITEVFRSDELKHVVILGDPGSGKSTIGQYACLALASEIMSLGHEKIPFLVVLRDYAEKRRKEYQIIDYLNDKAKSYLGEDFQNEFVEQCLTKLNSVVIYDGLDEIRSAENKKTIRDDIQSFAERCEKNRVQHIITSRKVGYEEAPFNVDLFLHIELLPLEGFQIEKYVGDWYSERERDEEIREEKIQSLLQAISTNKAIGQLAENPLLLTLIALVHKAEANLPRQRSLLYERCVEAFLVARDRARDLISYDESEIRKCHEYLGYWMHSNANETCELPQLRASLNRFFAQRESSSSALRNRKVDEFIEIARRRCGLIIEKGGEFSFGHRSFREYFAARYINTSNYGMRELWNEIQDKIGNSHWHEVILLLAGILKILCERGFYKLVEKILSAQPRATTSTLAFDIVDDGNLVSEALLLRITDAVFETLLTTAETQCMSTCLRDLAKLQDLGPRKYILAKGKEIFNKVPGNQTYIALHRLVQMTQQECDLFERWGSKT